MFIFLAYKVLPTLMKIMVYFDLVLQNVKTCFNVFNATAFPVVVLINMQQLAATLSQQATFC